MLAFVRTKDWLELVCRMRNMADLTLYQHTEQLNTDISVEAERKQELKLPLI